MRTFESLKQLTLFQFRSMLRNKIALFFSLILPLAFLAIFGSMYAPSSGTRMVIGLVDQDRGRVSQTLLQAMEASGLYDLVPGEQAELQEKLARGQVRAVLILPEGLSIRVAARQGAAEVRIVTDPASSASGQAAGTLQSLIAKLDMDLQGTAPVLAGRPEPMAGLKRLNFIDYLMPGQLSFMLLSAGMVTVGIALAQQRFSGALRHMFSTPVSLSFWMLSRVVATLILAALQIGVLYGTAVMLFDVSLPSNVGGTVLMVCLAAMTTLAMGLAVGALSRSVDVAMLVSQILSFSMAFLGNAMTPLDNAPAIVQAIGKVVPVTYMTHSLKLVMMHGKGLGEVLPDIAVLVTVCAACFGAVIWRLRKQFVFA